VTFDGDMLKPVRMWNWC